jgi:Zn finger protein HypA/HybF involved in hydrogenase expression
MLGLANELPFEQQQLEKECLVIKLKNKFIQWKCLDCDFIFLAKANRRRCPACKSELLGGLNDTIKSTIPPKSLEIEKISNAKPMVASFESEVNKDSFGRNRNR